MCASARVTQSARDKTLDVDVTVESAETPIDESVDTVESAATMAESVWATIESTRSSTWIESVSAQEQRGASINVRKTTK